MPLEDRRALEQRVRDLEAEVARLRQAGRARGVRRRAAFTILGLPAWDVALGPAPELGEVRGHARGFLAVGDVATGVLAIGGIARGALAFGGVSIGLVTWGGVSLGLLLTVGGAAAGGAALGGGAIGGVAIGGGAVGWYAMGGGAAGAHVVSADRRDPEAAAFFGRLGLPVPPPRR